MIGLVLELLRRLLDIWWVVDGWLATIQDHLAQRAGESV